jgi:hypothetical protein
MVAVRPRKEEFNLKLEGSSMIFSILLAPASDLINRVYN